MHRPWRIGIVLALFAAGATIGARILRTRPPDRPRIESLLARASSLSIDELRSLAPPLVTDEIRDLAQALRDHGDLDRFVDLLDLVPVDSPHKPKACLEQGRALWELGDTVRMEQVLHQCIELESSRPGLSENAVGALGTLGDHYVGQERFDEARGVIWKVFDAGRQGGHAETFYLATLLRLRYESAEPEFGVKENRRFLARNPDDADAHRALGIYLARMGKWDEARKHFEQALKARPTVPRFLESWLWFLLQMGEMDAARRVVEKLPAQCDSIPEFWIYRGKLADDSGDGPRSIACFERALELEPHRLDANNLLALTYRKAGRFEDADRRTAKSKELAGAFREVADVYSHVRLRKEEAATPEICAKLSQLCRQLNWNREAEGWAHCAAVQRAMQQFAR